MKHTVELIDNLFLLFINDQELLDKDVVARDEKDLVNG